MGAFMKEDDIYIGTFIDLFNIRFAPTPSGDHESCYGGISEIAALQTEFNIFRPDRPFSASAALLGLGGIYSARARNRWFELLRHLPPKGAGDQQIADALLENFNKDHPLPCYMQAHPAKTDNRVIITVPSRPLFYMEQDYLTISLPMAPKPPPK